VVNNSLSVLHGYEDAKPEKFWGHDLNFLGSRDVINVVTNGLGVGTFLLVVNDNHASILHRYGDIGLKLQICVQPMLRSKSLLRMPGVTWPVGRGSNITTYLEFSWPYFLFTVQLLWAYVYSWKFYTEASLAENFCSFLGLIFEFGGSFRG